MSLTHQQRKQRPVCTGVLDYFPDALLEVAHCSFVCNEQHNPGQPMHWAKDKSIGRGDEIIRHLADRGKIDSDGVRHSAKMAWRALELLQREIEAELGLPNKWTEGGTIHPAPKSDHFNPTQESFVDYLKRMRIPSPEPEYDHKFDSGC